MRSDAICRVQSAAQKICWTEFEQKRAVRSPFLVQLGTSSSHFLTACSACWKVGNFLDSTFQHGSRIRSMRRITPHSVPCTSTAVNNSRAVHAAHMHAKHACRFSLLVTHLLLRSVLVLMTPCGLRYHSSPLEPRVGSMSRGLLGRSVCNIAGARLNVLQSQAAPIETDQRRDQLLD